MQLKATIETHVMQNFSSLLGPNSQHCLPSILHSNLIIYGLRHSLCYLRHLRQQAKYETVFFFKEYVEVAVYPCSKPAAFM